MAVQEIRRGSLLVMGVTAQKLDKLKPWLYDGERMNQKWGTWAFSERNSLERVKNEEFGHLGIPVATPEGRWSVVDLKINLGRGEVYVVLHPGQPDVDLNPVANALNS